MSSTGLVGLYAPFTLQKRLFVQKDTYAQGWITFSTSGSALVKRPLAFAFAPKRLILRCPDPGGVDSSRLGYGVCEKGRFWARVPT